MFLANGGRLMKQYTLTHRLYHKFQSRGLNLVCYLCDQQLTIGQEIYSSQCHCKTHFFHKKCLDKSRR